MDKEETLKRIKEIFEESLDQEVEDLALDKYIFKDMDIESTDLMELTFRIETEFDFTFDNDFWNLPGYIVNEGMFENGTFTEEAIELINKFVNIPREKLCTFESPFVINDYYTINDLVLYIQGKING